MYNQLFNQQCSCMSHTDFTQRNGGQKGNVIRHYLFVKTHANLVEDKSWNPTVFTFGRSREFIALSPVCSQHFRCMSRHVLHIKHSHKPMTKLLTSSLE